jgi:hypothetical protein
MSMALNLVKKYPKRSLYETEMQESYTKVLLQQNKPVGNKRSEPSKMEE